MRDEVQLEVPAYSAYVGRVMLIFEEVIFPLWNHLFLCYPGNADFKTALVFKIGPILLVDVNF